MPKFHVRDAYEIPFRHLFALSGSVVEGEIRKGMYVPVMFNPSVQLTARIHSVEYTREPGDRDNVCLCLETGPKMLNVWNDLNIKNTTLEIRTGKSRRRPVAPKKIPVTFGRHHDVSFPIEIWHLD